mgnify:FL=1
MCGDDDDALACENMGFVATQQPLMNRSYLRIAISYRSQTYPITLEDASTVSTFQDLIFDTVGVRPVNQKILVPPKARQLLQTLRAGTTTQATIRDVGLSDCMQITVIGAPDNEIKEVQAEEEKWDKARAKRRQLHPSLLKNATPQKRSMVVPESVLGKIVVHPSVPSSNPWYAEIFSYLNRLASDPAILHVCHLHGYKVGTLTELLPHEHPELLGLNINMGDTILLRIRTDAADGLRDYKTTRRVLIHELCHIEIAGHPPEFNALNSQLNREVEAFEHNRILGTHRLSKGPVYEPANTVSVDADEEREERRRKILAATEKRLADIDQNIQSQCGDSKKVPFSK